MQEDVSVQYVHLPKLTSLLKNTILNVKFEQFYARWKTVETLNCFTNACIISEGSKLQSTKPFSFVTDNTTG